jgi:hypothetical protein
MMLAQLNADVPKQLAEWVACAAFVALLGNELFKFVKNLKGKPANPPNELLDQSQTALSARTGRNENSIRTLYAELAQIRRDFTHELREQTQEIVSAGERRHADTTHQFKEIAATLARLDERTKPR